MRDRANSKQKRSDPTKGRVEGARPSRRCVKRGKAGRARKQAGHPRQGHGEGGLGQGRQTGNQAVAPSRAMAVECPR